MRLVAFFVLAFVLAGLLGHIPVIGGLFRDTGVIGLLLAAGLLSALLTHLGARLLTAGKVRSEVTRLGAVGSAHNRGKAGMLLLANGRARAAVPELEAAAQGEPGVAEWSYRLGLAHLATRAFEPARAAFRRCVELEEEHAYGAAQLRLAECHTRLGNAGEALTTLDLFERNHGPSAESAYRRGLALRRLGKRSDARAAFGRSIELARAAARYQRGPATGWALRAGLARWL